TTPGGAPRLRSAMFALVFGFRTWQSAALACLRQARIWPAATRRISLLPPAPHRHVDLPEESRLCMAELHPVGFLGLGTYVPERILTNHDLERMVETSDEWIVTRTGIRERHICADDKCTS